MGTFFAKMTLKINMGRGFETPAADPRLNQIWASPGTVVWNDYLLIFSQKCHILFHKKSWKLVANNQIY